MSEYGSEGNSVRSPTESSISVPFLVLASVLIGLGLAGMAYWLVTFQWLYFASVIPTVLGGYMLFTRGTGPDRA
jgi:Na+/proline symporter